MQGYIDGSAGGVDVEEAYSVGYCFSDPFLGGYAFEFCGGFDLGFEGLREAALAKEPARLEGKRQERSEANAARREMLAAVYAEMCSFPEMGLRRVEQDIAAGGECLYEEKLVMQLMIRLHYPENAVREAVRVIVRNGWRMPEEEGWYKGFELRAWKYVRSEEYYRQGVLLERGTNAEILL